MFKSINEEVCETLSDDEIHEIMVDNFQSEFKRVYPIPIHIRVTSYDNQIDISNQIQKAIDDKNIYYHLNEKLIDRKLLPDERSDLLKQLEDIKDDYNAMLTESNELIDEVISFYLQSDDVIIEDTFDESDSVYKPFFCVHI